MIGSLLKHGISFWKYLTDRTSEKNQILPMAEIIQKTLPVSYEKLLKKQG
jgi:hypothetical protein